MVQTEQERVVNFITRFLKMLTPPMDTSTQKCRPGIYVKDEQGSLGPDTASALNEQIKRANQAQGKEYPLLVGNGNGNLPTVL